MHVAVLAQVVGVTKRLLTYVTGVRFLASVPPHVILVVSLHVERFGAVLALVWFFTCIEESHVIHVQISLSISS